MTQINDNQIKEILQEAIQEDGDSLRLLNRKKLSENGSFWRSEYLRYRWIFYEVNNQSKTWSGDEWGIGGSLTFTKKLGLNLLKSSFL